MSSDFFPICATQAGPLPDGTEHPRWVPGSVIKWTAWRQGFENQDDSMYATEQMALATEAWNSQDIGVSFEWVPLAKDATFVLVHGGNRGNSIAEAFFPNENDLSYFRICDAAFSNRRWKENMWKVFAHELGHVLGLRHEFTAQGIAGGNGNADASPRDESVMTYSKEPRDIHQSDRETARAFYSLVGDENGNPPKVYKAEVKDYSPY